MSWMDSILMTSRANLIISRLIKKKRNLLLQPRKPLPKKLLQKKILHLRKGARMANPRRRLRKGKANQVKTMARQKWVEMPM
jgi:hypothetical protein